jgi:hypothetical protein
VAAAALAGFTVSACKRRERKIRVQQTEEDAAILTSVARMSDPHSAPQLLKGFYAIENNSWRWTAGSFAVALRPPRNAMMNGATLHLRFALPDAVLAKVKTVTLSASVNGTALPPETYTKAGEFDYSRDVDAKLLAGEAVNIEFKLDHFVPAGAIEDRELGVIASSAGLEPK